MNLSGSFVLGLLFALLTERWVVDGDQRVAMTVGFVGSYTTVSTFALETLRLGQDGRPALAAAQRRCLGGGQRAGRVGRAWRRHGRSDRKRQRTPLPFARLGGTTPVVGVPGSLVGESSNRDHGGMPVSTGHDPGGAAGAMPGRRIPRPVRRFLATEAAGGVVLLVAAVAALLWANSGWSASYDTLWGTELGIELGRFRLSHDLRHWVNEGLMALFFLVVGLEIKRELVAGELRDRRAAAMPALAALGGMVVPALLYLLLNAGGQGSRGWGVPMATDIAFALGVLAVLGSRVPAPLKLFLLTLAIVDDIGAILVIAVFYASDLQPGYLAAAAALVGVMAALHRVGVVWLLPYVVIGAGVWLVTQASGVHATIAGVVLGLLAPARPLTAAAVARRWAGDLSDEPGPSELAAVTRLSSTSVSPAERIEHLLHPWTSYLVVPVFALANAGVEIRAGSFDAPGAGAVAGGIALGLVAGKALGITAAAWLAVRSGLGRLPDGATWPMVAGVAILGGIGFTVSLFVADLAFEPGALQDAAKLGVLGASTLAAVTGAAVLMRAARRARPS